MSRRHRAEKREVIPDAKFGDLVLTKFMNSLMKDGKKSTAERIVYGAFDKMEEKGRKNEPREKRIARHYKWKQYRKMQEYRSYRWGAW